MSRQLRTISFATLIVLQLFFAIELAPVAPLSAETLKAPTLIEGKSRLTIAPTNNTPYYLRDYTNQTSTFSNFTGFDLSNATFTSVILDDSDFSSAKMRNAIDW